MNAWITAALNLLAGRRVDRVRDIGVELGAAVGVAHRPVFVELAAARVAEPRPEVVLAPALVAPVGEFPTRHRHEDALRPLDDFQIPDDEGVVEGDRAEREQPLAVHLAQLDANFRDDHRCSPYSAGSGGETADHEDARFWFAGRSGVSKRLREAGCFFSGSAHRERGRPAAGHQRPARAEPAESLANLLHRGRQLERRLLQPVEERPANGLRVAGSRTAARSESPVAGFAGTSSRRYTSAVASPIGGHTRTKSSDRPTGSGVTTLTAPFAPRGRRSQEERHVRPDDRRHNREFISCLRQFPDLIQGQQSYGRVGTSPRQARPASGCAW